ncbi:helix-turn-helix domain-containing protein [Klenkia taihuensis]|uniref:helix-turn-helix domain-containing protein n=1 Tax=Klenkia taihuensis TaxID=1225127 RepID=UPI00104236FD|nr:helix-turn-helix domain-containing protein [Klenkia taihuensis]
MTTIVQADPRWDDLEVLPVRLPQQEVARLAAVQTGLPEDAFRFLSPRPRSPEHGRMWVRTAKQVSQQLRRSPAEPISPLLHRALVVLAAATALEVFPSTALTRGYLPAPGDVRPAAVRRAVAYIDAHLSLPITTGDAAAAAGTSPHALRVAFRRHLGTSVGAYLRRARCSAARRDLDAAEDGGAAMRSVSLRSVALRWGFAGAGDLRAALAADRPAR